MTEGKERGGTADRRDFGALEKRVRDIEQNTDVRDAVGVLDGRVKVAEDRIGGLMQTAGKEPLGIGRMITAAKWIGVFQVATLILVAVFVVLGFDMRGDMKLVYPLAFSAREMVVGNIVETGKLRDLMIEERTVNRLFREAVLADKATAKK